MKNIFITICLLLSVLSFSQEIENNAIGLRIGNNNTDTNLEISYQRFLFNNSRFEVNLALADGFKATGLYELVYNLDGNLNWYAGAGAGIAGIENSSAVFIAGIGGLEYNFDFPFLISIDAQPQIAVGEAIKTVTLNAGLGLRYQF